jgi:curved DNA-binding protein CbpA
MSSRRSLYDQLGVPPTASAEQIRSAYRRAARRAHPDAGGSPLAFDRLTAAYRVLADPGRRHSYDRWLAAGRGDRRGAAGGSERPRSGTERPRRDAETAKAPATPAAPAAPATPDPVPSRARARYLAMMLIAVSLFVAAGTIVRWYSLAAAAAMMFVAMLIPPTAAIMANRPRVPTDTGPAGARQDDDRDPDRARRRARRRR